MSEEGAQPVRRGGSLNLPSVLTLLWVFRQFEKNTDSDRPEIVRTNAKSKAVLDQAEQLAGEGREDPRAVAELRATARNRRRTLEQAERASRFMGYHHELSRANLANRLLKAALDREAVPSPPTARDMTQIEAVESFDRLARDQQWVLLTQLQPALRNLESEVRAGRFGPVATRDYNFLKDRTSIEETAEGERRRVVTLSSADPPPSEEEMHAIRQQGECREALRTRLGALVGPRCGDNSPVVQSQRALDVANAHLERQARLCATAAQDDGS